MPLKASPAEIQKFSSDMHDKHGQLISLINQVKANEDATTATWSGEARGAFDSFMERYYELARQMNNQLQQTADNVASAGKTFEGADQSHSADIANASSSLNL